MDIGYLLAVVPPKKIADFADKYREKYAKYTGYRSPPHITIYPPFYLTGIDEEEFKELLKKNLKNFAPFQVRINSVNFFTGRNNVLYFKPDERSKNYLKSALESIFLTIKLCTKPIYNYYIVEPDSYRPHMTIAERIPKEVFSKLKQELSKEKVNFTFEVDSIWLLVQPEGSKVWKVKEDIKF
jgi:2'-5' RNA ligase